MSKQATIQFSELYEVPSKNGLMAPSKVRGSGPLLVNMREIFAFDRIADQEMERAPIPERNSEAWLLQSGDLLFARQSLTLAGAGKVSIVLAPPEPMTFESHLIRVRLDPAKADAGFYYYLFRSSFGRALVASIAEQVAAAGIRASDLGKLRVPHPDLREQRRISSVLGALDDLIDNHRALAVASVALAKAVLQDAPAADAYTVRGVAEVRRGLSYKGTGLSDSGMLMVNMGSAANFGWLQRGGWKHYIGEYKPRHIACARDLILVNTEQTWRQEIIGWPMLVPSDVSETLFTHHTNLVDFRPESAWLRLPLWSYLFTDQARSLIDGSIRGTTVANLPVDVIEGMTFPAPPQNHPSLLAAEALLESAWSDELAAEDLAHTRDDLLPLLMSGKVRASETMAGT